MGVARQYTEPLARSRTRRSGCSWPTPPGQGRRVEAGVLEEVRFATKGRADHNVPILRAASAQHIILARPRPPLVGV